MNGSILPSGATRTARQVLLGMLLMAAASTFVLLLFGWVTPEFLPTDPNRLGAHPVARLLVGAGVGALVGTINWAPPRAPTFWWRVFWTANLMVLQQLDTLRIDHPARRGLAILIAAVATGIVCAGVWTLAERAFWRSRGYPNTPQV